MFFKRYIANNASVKRMLENDRMMKMQSTPSPRGTALKRWMRQNLGKLGIPGRKVQADLLMVHRDQFGIGGVEAQVSKILGGEIYEILAHAERFIKPQSICGDLDSV